MFQMNIEDINYIFEQAAQTILINDVPRNVIITNPQMNEDETRYLHTLDRMLQGDLVVLEGEKYLSITESNTKRHSKYKNKIQHCNQHIEVVGEMEKVLIGYDDRGRPVYEEVLGDPILIPSIVERGTFTVDSGGSFLVPQDVLYVTVQDNEMNRRKFPINITIKITGLNYVVQHQDLTRKGLIILRLKQ